VKREPLDHTGVLNLAAKYLTRRADAAARALGIAMQRTNILRDLDESTRSEVVGLLAYKEDVAGGRMSPRFSRLRPDSTVDEAIAYLRRQATQVETIYYAYAVDDEQHLLGVVSLGDLFVAERTKRVKDVMRTSFVSVTENADQEERTAKWTVRSA